MGLLTQTEDPYNPDQLDGPYGPYNPPPDFPVPAPLPTVNWGEEQNKGLATPAPAKGNGGAGLAVGGGGYGSFYNFGAVPKFDAPAFVRPDAKSILNAPGYQARLQSGEQALQRSAASKGLLRSGGTLKDLIEYGQNFASNEYNNEFQQALQTYGANHQLAKDKYAPLLAEWDLHSKGEIQRALAAYNRQTVWENPHAGGGGGGGTYDPFPSPGDYV